MGINFRKTALLLMAAMFPLVSFGAQPPNEHFPPESKAIFGIVVLGKTTVSELAHAVETLGCSIDIENNLMTVNSDCLSIAGNPKILVFENPRQSRPIDPSHANHLQNPLVADKVIECISLEFSPGTDWQEYIDSLRALWGYPSIYRDAETASERLALWRRKGIVIALTAKNNGPTYLTYSTPARLDRLLQEKKKSAPVERGKVLGMP